MLPILAVLATAMLLGIAYLAIRGIHQSALGLSATRRIRCLTYTEARAPRCASGGCCPLPHSSQWPSC